MLPNQLVFNRLPCLNNTRKSTGAIKSILFHPTQSLFIIGGEDRHIRLFNLDLAESQLLHDISLKSLPITSCEFFNSFQSLIITGKRPFYYTLDLETTDITINKLHNFHNPNPVISHTFNNYWLCSNLANEVGLFHNQNFQLINKIKIPQTISSINSFDNDILVSTEEGSIYIFDIRNTLKPVGIFNIETKDQITKMALSNDHIAIGTKSGFVDVFDRNVLTEVKRNQGISRSYSSLFSINNLVTPVDSLNFNHTGEALVLSSSYKRDAVRMVHLGSQTVYQNWPAKTRNLLKPTYSCFSPHSGLVTIGNHTGLAFAFRLPAFSDI
eukprot:TRINITY_DN1561_c1_g1_i1.p1 TRINITY_DN1561_c1_g1~~TRINITY_DN1561_c1_g1_i1.p1  ORF type:complete len:326 (+),score=61.12 TRINITY_DN1561_c1_g1_i1:45-1022(+)